MISQYFVELHSAVPHVILSEAKNPSRVYVGPPTRDGFFASLRMTCNMVV